MDDETRDERSPYRREREPTDVLAPTRVVAGKYQLGRLLGEGGMGTVYEAEHLGLGAACAVKLLSERFATHASAIERFRREARAAAAVRHDNIVEVTDTGADDDGTPFLVMELLEGESLSAFVKRERRIAPRLAAAIVDQVLAGLGAAHAAGIVHRDLKPGNVFLARRDDGLRRVKILDFGISKLAAPADDGDLTATGVAVGTPLFMAPEQARAERDVDARADLYAVGVLLYRLVTGKTPFSELPASERKRAIADGEFPAPRAVSPEIPEPLERVILRAMATDRDDRYADAAAFRAALRDVFPDLAEAEGFAHAPLDARTTAARLDTPAPPEPERRRWIGVSIVAVLAAALALGVWAWRRADDTPSVAGTAGADALRLGMTTYVPEPIQREIYGPIADHLAERLGRPVELALMADTEALEREFLAGRVAIAALTPEAYVRTRDAAPEVALLATPVTPGGASFEVHIVARADSDVRDLESLRGKVFCYVPSAASGYLVPRVMLRGAGLDPDTAFATTRLVDDHLGALRHVASGKCDATAVYASLYYEVDDYGLSPYAFRIVATSERIPNDAYCAHPSLPPALAERTRAALLELEPDSPTARRVFGERREIIGFTAVTDAAYDGIRAALRADTPD